MNGMFALPSPNCTGVSSQGVGVENLRFASSIFYGRVHPTRDGVFSSMKLYIAGGNNAPRRIINVFQCVCVFVRARVRVLLHACSKPHTKPNKFSRHL